MRPSGRPFFQAPFGRLLRRTEVTGFIGAYALCAYHGERRSGQCRQDLPPARYRCARVLDRGPTPQERKRKVQGRTQRIVTPPGSGAAQVPPVPEKLGKYEILEPIGEGGFGIVYKGFDPFIKRHVAIKTCTSPDKELRQRYYREAEIAGRLDHPNIVRIFDFGTESGTPYLVQEFLAGSDLDHKIEGRRFVPYPERLYYLIQIARGLAYAHAQQVIHRDIKPANIRILDDGTAKIMDFGVAMLQNTETRLTKDGMAVGTAAYLSPEQVKGKPTDKRTDIFSYGVLAYELLAGKRPFEQDSISATLFSILNDDPGPITLPTNLFPDALRQLITRCLEKDPEKRYPDFEAVLGDLEGIRQQMRSATGDRDFSSEIRNVASATGPAKGTTADSSGRSARNFDPTLHQIVTPPSIRLRRRRHWMPIVAPVAIVGLLAASYTALATQNRVPWPEGFADLGLIANLGLDPTENRILMQPTSAFHGQPEGAGSTLVFPTSEMVPEPVPPPPPVVEKASLTLAKGWHTGISASINGAKPVKLSGSLSYELEPGEYTVRYSLVTPEYQASRTLRTTLAPGEERTLSNPIDRPGTLSVQPSLGSPQGLVTLDGKPIGPSPLRDLPLPPGQHELQVFATSDPTIALVTAKFEIASTRETVVTFDLTGQRELAVRYRDLKE